MSVQAGYEAGSILIRRSRTLAAAQRRAAAALASSDAHLHNEAMMRFTAALNEEQWSRLRRQSMVDLRAGQRQLARLATVRDALDAAAGPVELAGPLPTLQFIEDDQRSATVTQFERLMKDRGASAAVARQATARLMDGSLRAAAQEVVKDLDTRLRSNMEQQMRRLALSVHLLAVADFNLHVANGTRRTADEAEQAIAGSAAFREATLADLRAYVGRRQWAAAATRARAMITRVGGTLATALVPAAAAAAQERAASLASGEASTTWDRIAVDIGGELAATLHLLALLRYVESRCLWPADADDLVSAAGLPQRSTHRLPAERALRSLAARPQQYLDTQLTVRGTVESLVVRHVRRKAVSIMAIAEGGQQIRAELHGIKIDSTGLVPGTAVALSGTWRRTGDAEPVLMIDRFEVAGAADASWPDWLRNETRGIYQPAAHGLAGAWSWEPGSDGPANPVRYGVFARNEAG